LISPTPREQVSGVTPLFMAVSNGATQCIELLREHGAVMDTDESSHKAEGANTHDAASARWLLSGTLPHALVCVCVCLCVVAVTAESAVSSSFLTVDVPSHSTYTSNLSTHLKVPHPHTT